MCNKDYLIVSINNNSYAINNNYIDTILELPTEYYNLIDKNNGTRIMSLCGYDMPVIELDNNCGSKIRPNKFVYLLVVNMGSFKYALQCDSDIAPNSNQMAKQKQQAYIFSELVFDAANPVRKYDEEQLFNLYIKHELPNRIAI